MSEQCTELSKSKIKEKNTKVRKINYLTENLNLKELSGRLKFSTMMLETCQTFDKNTNVVVGYRFDKRDCLYMDLSYLVFPDKSEQFNSFVQI